MPQVRMNWLPVLATVISLGTAASSGVADNGATLILLNGKIWTVDRERPEAQAIAVAAGRILAVGSNEEVLRWAGRSATTIDLDGRRVLPGIIDSHAHVLGGGLQLARVELKDAQDEAEFGRRIAAFDKRLPQGRWLLGGNWDHDRTFAGVLPTAELLAKYLTSDRPVLLDRYDGHMALASKAALKLAKITAETPDPPGGVIVRDPKTGEPTGVLRDTAMGLVGRLVPAPSDEEVVEGVLAALAEARKVGITGIDDMGGDGDPVRLFRLYQQLERADRMTARIHLRWPLANWKSLAEMGLQAGFGSDYVRVGGLKGFIDGSLGSTTAKFFAPYLNEPSSTGVFVTAPGTLAAWVEQADAAGLAVTVHAIGDEGNARLLDLFEAASQKNGKRDRRFRIEHVQHLRVADYPRFHAAGVIASMQPFHVVDDGRWAEGRIGKERCASSYAYRSLLDHKARLAFGSDWPVAPLNPWQGIDAAVNRRTLDGKNPNGWFPEQRITVAEAVEAYTLGSAHALFAEHRLGSISPGKLADFVVLSQDLFDPSLKDRLGETAVDMTIVGGKVVYTRED